MKNTKFFIKMMLLCIVMISSLLTTPLHSLREEIADYFTTRLPNGMEVVLHKTASSSVGLYLFVRTGSIHEGEFLGSGISHYLEHVVSGGSTPFRTEAEYIAIVQSIGAMRNAFTSQERTCYHITVESEYVDIALEMLSEQVLYCSFDEDEVAREKEVIKAEILMRSSPPTSQVRQRFSEVAYANTHSRYPTIGFVEHFDKITRADLIKYYESRYTPYNMIFVAVGGFETLEMLSKIETTFADFVRPPVPEIVLPIQPTPAVTNTVTEEFDIEMAQVMMLRSIPYMKPQEHYALVIAANLFTGRRNSPLRYHLVEEAQLVNSIHMSSRYAPIYNNSGLHISFETKKLDEIDKIVDSINDMLQVYIAPDKITQKMVDDVVQWMEDMRHLETSQSLGNLARGIGNSMLHHNVPNYQDYMIDELKKITSEDVINVIKEHFLGNKVIFYAVPTTPTAYVMANNHSPLQTASEIAKITLNDHLTILHKQTKEKPVVTGRIFLPITTNVEDETNTGSIEFMANLLFKGSKKYPSRQLSTWLEDRSISLYTEINQRGITINFKCLIKDLDEVRDIIIDGLTQPLFDQSEISVLQNRMNASTSRRVSNPETQHNDFYRRNINTHTRDQMSETDKMKIVNLLTTDDLLAIHRKYLTADSIIVALLGDIDEVNAATLVENIYENIPRKDNINEISTIISPQIVVQDSIFINTYTSEQVNVHIHTLAPVTIQPLSTQNEGESDDTPSDFVVMDVIRKLLWGSNGRLNKATRKDNDLVYFTRPMYVHTNDYAYFYVHSQTSMDRYEELVAVLKNEFHRLKTEPVTDEEKELAIMNFNKYLKNAYSEETFMQLALSDESRGLGYDWFDASITTQMKVTAEDILRVANKYFEQIDVFVSKREE